MKLFDKRNIVLIMSIFLLLLMVSSVSAADVSEDAVVGNDAAIDTITSTDTSGSIDDVISAEVSDNPKADPSDSNESLSGDIVADASSNNDNINQNTVDDSSQDVLKASSDDEVLSADVPIDLTLHVGIGPGYDYDNLQDAIDALLNPNRNYEIVIHEGTYTGAGNRDVHIIWSYLFNRNFQYLLIRAADGETVTFDGQNRYTLFSVRSSNVHIQGINFINANTSSEDDGGVCISITNGADHITIDHCNFTNNGRDSTYGGAIRVNGGSQDINLTNCYFENNTASVGGGIRSEQGTSSIHLVNCTAVHNYGSVHGGFACLFGSDTALENCTFEDNYAPSSGAVHCHSGNVTVKNCTFVNNSAIGGGTNATNGYAGALGLVYAGSPGVTVLDSHFYNNTAVNDGGAVQVMGTGRDAKIINSDFENNTAAYGGAVSIKGTNTVITDSNFTDCNASQYGGAVQVIGSGTNINNCNFEGNNALPDEDKKDDGLGGAIYIQGTDCHVTDSDFTHNTARNGSAIYVNPNGTGINYINGCDFFENQAWVYWLPILYDNATHKIETNLTGGNNIINAIYNNGTRQQLRINGTIPEQGWQKSQGGTVPYQDDLEADQEIVIIVFDREGNIVFNETRKTNLSGTVSVDIPSDTSSWYLINMTHTEDPYYKHITNITAININPGITVSNVTMYEGNESAQNVTINLLDSSGKPIDNATINVTVIVNGQPISIGFGQTDKNGVLHISESTVFKILEPGTYTIQATYSYLYWNSTTGRNETKTLVGNGTLKVLPYEWDLTKTIVSVNGKPYTEGMEIHVYDNITFNITVTNLVDADITSVKITDVNTDNLTYVSTESGSPWSLVGDNVWSLANLAAKQNSSLILTFNITQVGESINVATASIFNGKEEKSAEASLTADKCPSSVNGTDVTVVYGEDIVVTVASENATAVIYNITNAAGVVVADTPMAANGTISGLGLAVGEYTVNYVTVVDANHTVATNTSKIIVTPAPSAVSAEDVEVTYGEPITVNVASENATGVTYVITGEGVELSGTVQDGVITIDKDYLLAGEYTVTLTTQVDANHTVATNTSKITVNRLSIIIETTTTISDASGKPGETVTLDVEVTTEDGTPFNGDVVITCPDGKKVTVTVKDGKGQFDWTIPEDAKAGDEYQFTATFKGNSTYLASSGNGTVSVYEDEPQPEPPVPEEPEEPVPEVVPAKMLNTGNPLVALLAAFVLIGLGLKRREEE